MMQPLSLRHKKIALCLLIAGITFLAYLPVKDNGFINYDDEEYVTANKNVQGGLTFRNLQWAFAAMEVGNWHPLTWLSHMVDYDLFGPSPAGHHLTSLLLHIFNSLLLFLVLNRMTHALWRSALAAALFALHPLHVESVAWVAERKDVLCALFCILSMGAYALYAERPGFARYGLIFLTLALALMAKPMAVTLPFVFLLLDYWPLRRYQPPRLPVETSEKSIGSKPALVQKKAKRKKSETSSSERSLSSRQNLRTPATVLRLLVIEKIPLFTLTALCSVLTYIAQQKSGTVAALQTYTLVDRLQNAVLSYVRYIVKIFYPVDLSCFYPYVAHQFWQIAGSALLLTAVVLLVVRFRDRFPHLFVGWFWYLGTLVPVIGIVKVGLQSMADRYTYLPSIGLFVLIVWGVHDLTRKMRRQAAVLGTLAAVVLVLFSAATWNQARQWEDDLTLYRHALKVDADNQVAHFGLGLYYSRQGDLDRAFHHYTEAIRIMPTQPDYLNNIAGILNRLGRPEEAAACYRKAIALQDNNALPHFNYAYLLACQGKFDEAVPHFQRVLALNPDDMVACIMLADVLSGQRKLDEALQYYSRALQMDPNRGDINFAMGKILALQGKNGEAAVRFRRVIQLDFAHVQAHEALGEILLSEGRIDEAVAHFQEVLRIKPDNPKARKLLSDAIAGKRTLHSK